MVLDPPPSSKRLRKTEMEIDAAIESDAIRGIFGQCIERVSLSKGMCLVVHPNDCFEVADFIRQIVKRLGLNHPHMVRSMEPNAVFSLQRRDLTQERGMVLLNAETLPFRVLPALEELLCDPTRPKLVIAQFTRMKGFSRAFNEWPPSLRGEFDQQPLVWPQLNVRCEDVPEILNRVCAKLVSRDGLYRAILSRETREALLQGTYRSVGRLVDRIRGAFDVSLNEEASVISLRHLAIADEPESRRMIFSQPAPSSSAP